MKNFTFHKEEDNRWYIVLPTWTGDKSDLEMVCGADTMLDIMSQGETVVNLSISEQIFKGYSFRLEYSHDENGGGWYNLYSQMHEFEVWLCYVTEFVYGYFPQKLYLS